MGKNAKTAETRKPSAEQLTRVEAARLRALQAEADVGRAFIQILNLARVSSDANAEHQNAHAKAALSVGIDPTGEVPWVWDPLKQHYTKKD